MAPKDGKPEKTRPLSAEERALREERIIRQIRNEPLYRDDPHPEEVKAEFEMNVGELKEPGKKWEAWQYVKSFYTDHDFIVGFMALKGGVSGVIAAAFLVGTYVAAAPFLTAAALVAGVGALATIGIYGMYIGAKGTIKALKGIHDRISGDREEWVYKQNNLSPEQVVQLEKAKVYRFKRLLRRKVAEKGVTPEILAGVMPELLEEELSPTAQKIRNAKHKTLNALRSTKLWQWAEKTQAWKKFNNSAPVRAVKNSKLWQWTKTIVEDNELMLSTLAIKGSVAQLIFEAMIFTTTLVALPFVAAAATVAMAVGTIGLCALAIWHSGGDFVRGIRDLPKKFAEGRERDKKLRQRLKRKRQHTKGLDISDTIEERVEAEEEAQKVKNKATIAQEQDVGESPNPARGVKKRVDADHPPAKDTGRETATGRKAEPARPGVAVEAASKSVELPKKGDASADFGKKAEKTRKTDAPANDDAKPRTEKPRRANGKPGGPGHK